MLAATEHLPTAAPGPAALAAGQGSPGARNVWHLPDCEAFQGHQATRLCHTRGQLSLWTGRGVSTRGVFAVPYPDAPRVEWEACAWGPEGTGRSCGQLGWPLSYSGKMAL